MTVEFSLEEVEGRLSAQRYVLQWLLSRTNAEPAELRQLMAALEDNYPPLDHQEDPGAVPTNAFGALAAYTVELRLLLEPVKARLEHDDEVSFGEG